MQYPTHSRTDRLERFAAIALVLNLLDAVFTMTWIETGLAVEANPLMDTALSASPVLFVLAKTSLVSLGLLLLWRLRTRAAAAAGIVGAAAVYTLVVAYHLKSVMA